jgi:MFS family permease
MLSEARFYYLLPAMIATPMIGTALFFFPDEIARAKGWSSLWVTGNYWLYSIVSVTVTIYSGALIDRFSARRVLPFFLLPLGLSLVIINLSSHEYLVWPFMLLQGMTSGLYFTGLSALWAELYGPRHLGAINNQVADQRNHGVFVGAGPGGGWHTAAMAGVVFCDYDIAGRVLCQRDADAVLRAANAQ